MQINDVECIECEKIKYTSTLQQLTNTKNSNNNTRKKEYDSFILKYKKIFPSANTIAQNINKIKIKSSDLLNTLTQLVPCIGCRTSVERFYKQLLSSTNDLISNNDRINSRLNDLNGDNNCNILNNDEFSFDDMLCNNKNVLSFALDPLVIYKNGYLSINENLFNSKSLFELFYMHG
jgi:hypothetical protein